MSFFLNVLGCMLGIIGIILAVFFYRKGRRFKKLTYTTRSFTLLSDNLSSLNDFSATYKTHQLKTLVASNVLIWNSGTEVINSEDISDADKLCIKLVDNAYFLDASIVCASDPTNLVARGINKNAPEIIELLFDYLAPNQGFIISTLHTSDKPEALQLSGTIKGGTKPILHKIKMVSRMHFTSAVIGLTIGISSNLIYSGYFINKGATTFLLFGFTIFLCYILSVIIGELLSNKFNSKAGGVLDKRFEFGFSPEDFGN